MYCMLINDPPSCFERYELVNKILLVVSIFDIAIYTLVRPNKKKIEKLENLSF